MTKIYHIVRERTNDRTRAAAAQETKWNASSTSSSSSLWLWCVGGSGSQRSQRFQERGSIENVEWVKGNGKHFLVLVVVGLWGNSPRTHSSCSSGSAFCCWLRVCFRCRVRVVDARQILMYGCYFCQCDDDKDKPRMGGKIGRREYVCVLMQMWCSCLGTVHFWKGIVFTWNLHTWAGHLDGHKVESPVTVNLAQCSPSLPHMFRAPRSF